MNMRSGKIKRSLSTDSMDDPIEPADMLTIMKEEVSQTKQMLLQHPLITTRRVPASDSYLDREDVLSQLLAKPDWFATFPKLKSRDRDIARKFLLVHTVAPVYDIMRLMLELRHNEQDNNNRLYGYISVIAGLIGHDTERGRGVLLRFARKKVFDCLFTAGGPIPSSAMEPLSC